VPTTHCTLVHQRSPNSPPATHTRLALYLVWRSCAQGAVLANAHGVCGALTRTLGAHMCASYLGVVLPARLTQLICPRAPLRWLRGKGGWLQSLLMFAVDKPSANLSRWRATASSSGGSGRAHWHMATWQGRAVLTAEGDDWKTPPFCWCLQAPASSSPLQARLRCMETLMGPMR